MLHACAHANPYITNACLSKRLLIVCVSARAMQHVHFVFLRGRRIQNSRICVFVYVCFLVHDVSDGHVVTPVVWFLI